MLLIGERVDHAQPRCGLGEFAQKLLREGSDHDRIDPALEVSGDVRHELTTAEGGVGLQPDDMTAKLVNRDFERRSGPQRRLLEEQRDLLAGERPRAGRIGAKRSIGFELGGQIEAAFELRRVEIEYGEEVLVSSRNRGR
jgi:hypothetical protein